MKNDRNLESHKQEKRREVTAFGITEISASPLPSPTILRQYDEVVAGAAERIVTMAEAQSKHRQDMERKVIRSRILNSRLGLIFGLSIGLASLAAATASAMAGSTLVGSVIGVSGLASLVGVFVYGSQQQRHEREEKLKQIRLK